MRRKAYDSLLAWKNGSAGKTALLVQGARRVGKSYIVEEFAKKEYRSYILIDFNKAGEQVKESFQQRSERYAFILFETVRIVRHIFA